MDFRILGPLEVIHDGHAVPLPGARQRELLALLLLDAGRVISAERLMEDLLQCLAGPREPTPCP